MSSQSYSSIGVGRRRGTAHDDIDRSFYTVGQTLASIVNDPRAPSQSGGFWGLSSEASQLPPPPALDPVKYPPVSKADLQRYLEVVHVAYDKFVKDRQSLEAFDAQHQGRRSSERLSSSSSQQQGEPFMVAVQAVPQQFFQEDFFEGWDEFFKQYCQEQSAEELYEQIDLINRNLDVVELQLLCEVSIRSSSFFQAASTLQGLQGHLADAVGCIQGLRQELAAADVQLYSTAAAVKALQARRDNLQDTLDITKGLEEVAAAQAALDVMLEGQEYAGALDLLGQLRALLQTQQLGGLQCLRHLPGRLQDVSASVDAALAGEFLGTVGNGDVRRLVAEAAAEADRHPDASTGPDGMLASTSAPWTLFPPSSTSQAAAAEEQLQEKLLPLAVGLYRSEGLYAILQQYKANAGEEVKAAVRDVVQAVLPVLLAAAGDSLAVGQAGGPGAGREGQAWEQLQLLHHGAFMVLLYAAGRVILSCIHHTVAVGRVLEAILTGLDTPTNQSLPVLKACGVAVQVVCDVGLGRWVKLLNARSTAHTRLKQYELKQILDLSEQVAAAVEAVGCRPLSSFRLALQGQCKALLDAGHSRAMTQLQGLLEAEQWVAVDVPAGFQAIVDRLLLRCAEGAALLDGRAASPAGAAGTHPHTSSSSSGTRRSSAGAGASPDRTSAGGRSSAAGRESDTAADGVTSASSGPGGGLGDQPVLHLCGKSFHLVNSGLMLLKMVDEYMSLHDLMPHFGAEIVHRQLELLKLFNSQTAALVLGAGAMRTAGLRSISAKQLALSCQAIAMLSTLLQPLRAGCLALVSQPRRALLMPEYDRLLQDLTMHIDEVHSKLVDIMRDRLAAAVQTLPAEVRAAAPTGGSSSLAGPTPTIALLAKQLATLRAVLVPLLLREEVEFIFGAVSRSYSDALSDLFESLLAEPNSGWEPVVQMNALTMLETFRDLPLDPARSNNYSARLLTTYTKHFGLPPWDQQRLGHKQQHTAGRSSNSSSDDTLQEQQRQLQQQPAGAVVTSSPQQPHQQQQNTALQEAPTLQPPPSIQQQQHLNGSNIEAAAAAAAAAAVVGAAAAAAGHAAVPAPDPLEAVLAPPASNGLHPAASAAAAAAAAAAEQQGSADSLPVVQLDGQLSSAAGQFEQQQQSSIADLGLNSLPSTQPLQQQDQQREQLEQQQEQQQQVPDDMDVHQLSPDELDQPWPAAHQGLSTTQDLTQQQQQQDLSAALQHQGELSQQQQQQQQQEQEHEQLVSALHNVQPDTRAAAAAADAADVALEGPTGVPSSDGWRVDDGVNHTGPLAAAAAAAAEDISAAVDGIHKQQQLHHHHLEPQQQDQEQHPEPQHQQQHPEPQQQQQQQEVLSYLDQPPVFDEPDYLGAWGPGGGGGGEGGVDSTHLHLLNGLLGETAAADAEANSTEAAAAAFSSPGAEVYELPAAASAAGAGAEASILGSSPNGSSAADASVAGGQVKAGPSCPLDLLDAELAGLDEGEAALEPAAAAKEPDAVQGSAAAEGLQLIQQQQQVGMLESLDLQSAAAAGFDDVSLEDSNTHGTLEQQQQQQQVEPIPVQHTQQQQQQRRADRPTPELYASLLQPEEAANPQDPSPFEHLAALPAAALPAGSASLAPHVTGAPAAAAGGSNTAAAAAAAGGVVGGSSSSSSSSSWDPLGVSSSAPPAEAVVERLGSSAGWGHSSSTRGQGRVLP